MDSLDEGEVVLMWADWTSRVPRVWSRGSRVCLSGRRPARGRRPGAMVSGWVHIERDWSARPRAERKHYSLPWLSDCEEDFRECTRLVVYSMRLKETQK